MSKRGDNFLPETTFSSQNRVEKVYEDRQYIVFNKPAGLLVIPTPKNERRTLVTIANKHFNPENQLSKLHPCHRIDRETSGVILFAKGKQHQKLMMEMFRLRQVTKTYIAFVHGKLPGQRGEFRAPVRSVQRVKYGRPKQAASAITKYKVLKIKKGFSVVEVRPVTGRTNQIRIHFSEARHPLVGDRKFAFARDYFLKFRRTALHAHSLEWAHPVTHKKIHVQSDLPKDMAEFLASN